MKDNPSMSASILGREYAFPGPAVGGLTKREWLAGLVMQGLMSIREVVDENTEICIARLAVSQADVLLEELAKEGAK